MDALTSKIVYKFFFFFFSSRRRHTRWPRDWSSDVCSSDLAQEPLVKEFGAAKSDEERQAVVARLPKLAAPFAAKAIALAEEDLKNPVAIRCRSEERRVGKECRSRRAQRQ